MILTMMTIIITTLVKKSRKVILIYDADASFDQSEVFKLTSQQSILMIEPITA